MNSQTFLNEAMKNEAFKDNETFVAYANYLDKQILKGHKVNSVFVGRDAQRNKVYLAENEFRSQFYQKFPQYFKKFDDISQAQQMADDIVRSDWWKNRNYHSMYEGVKVRCMGENKTYLGTARFGRIELSVKGMNNLILIHEICHCAGNMHHGIGFREAHINLLKALYGDGPANLLKESYKNHELKFKRNEIKIMDPEQWLKAYRRAQVARNHL